MKKIIWLFLFPLTLVSCGDDELQGRIYVDNVFSEVDILFDVKYGSGRPLVGTEIDLFMDIYQPIGDPNERRATIVMAHGGAFVTGTKSQIRSLCEAYAKKGYTVASISYRLINDPDIIFLDEPMSGLDPTGRYQVREVILSLKGQGKTIFFNSHILADVEVICDRIAILDQGELICQGSLHELLGSPDAYFVKGQGGSLDVLKKWLQNLTFEGGYWQGYLHGSPNDFMASVNLMNGRLITLDLRRLSLEDFFIQQIHQRRPHSS